MLFHLFCMFHDYWRIAHRSQDSAGKSTVRMQYCYIVTQTCSRERVQIIWCHSQLITGQAGPVEIYVFCDTITTNVGVL
jgi:hypothetical protein